MLSKRLTDNPLQAVAVAGQLDMFLGYRQSQPWVSD